MYSDNLKGFRRRNMIKKLELLMKQIEDVLEFAYEGGMYDDYTDLRDKLQHTEYIKERIDELEGQYSMIWRIKIQDIITDRYLQPTPRTLIRRFNKKMS